MTKGDNPRLCGGTFLVLILQALKQRVKARQHYKGERDGLSDPEVLIGLIKVINTDYQEPKEGALKGKTNDFKSCKTSTDQYLPFGNTPEIEVFDERVRNEYQDALGAMTEFVALFLETGTKVKKDERLVKALIDLIQHDNSIKLDEEFYIEENDQKIKKTALGGLDDVCLPAFLLGVWHYVVVNRKDNSVGRDTYDKWCPENGGTPRTYSRDMGKSITKTINVRMPETCLAEDDEIFYFGDEDADQPSDKAETDYDFDFGDEDAKTGTPPPTQQIINNPLFISQTGDNSNIIPNYRTMSLTLGKHGGGSNE